MGISATLEEGVGEQDFCALDISPVKHNVSENLGKNYTVS
jgi:hypothetical protein